jgi:Cof subfamily protein (haloacid dehalogenase superfamily)
MEINLIASDLDGTLLDDEKNISPENAKILRRALEKNIIFVPATGRSLESIPKAVFDFDVKYIICSNGAFVKDLTRDEVIFERLMSKDLIFKIFDMTGGRDDVIIDVFSGGKAVTEAKNFERLGEFLIPAHMLQYINDSRFRVEDLSDFLRECDYRVEKMHLLFKTPEIRLYFLKKLKELENAAITSSLIMNAEINSPGTSKGAALEFLCEYLRINIKTVIAFGDGDNDSEMLRTAGLGVAMGNAYPEAKEAADFIAKTNTENGFAEFLSSYL